MDDNDIEQLPYGDDYGTTNTRPSVSHRPDIDCNQYFSDEKWMVAGVAYQNPETKVYEIEYICTFSTTAFEGDRSCTNQHIVYNGAILDQTGASGNKVYTPSISITNYFTVL